MHSLSLSFLLEEAAVIPDKLWPQEKAAGRILVCKGICWNFLSSRVTSKLLFRSVEEAPFCVETLIPRMALLFPALFLLGPFVFPPSYKKERVNEREMRDISLLQKRGKQLEGKSGGNAGSIKEDFVVHVGTALRRMWSHCGFSAEPSRRVQNKKVR